MNYNEIIAAAREAGFDLMAENPKLVRFAAIIAARERDALQARTASEFVERQRDELLALLKSLLNYDSLGAYERANLRQQARKAIAKIKGEYK